MDSVGEETRSDILYSKLSLGTVMVMILSALKRTTPVFVVVGLSEGVGLAVTWLALESRTRASKEKDFLCKIIAVRVEDGSSLRRGFRRLYASEEANIRITIKSEALITSA